MQTHHRKHPKFVIDLVAKGIAPDNGSHGAIEDGLGIHDRCLSGLLLLLGVHGIHLASLDTVVDESVYLSHEPRYSLVADIINRESIAPRFNEKLLLPLLKDPLHIGLGLTLGDTN